MKKIFLAATIAVILSAGLALKTQAQPEAVNIESLYASAFNVKIPAVLNETPVYNKAGKLIYTVKRYTESSLPKEISRMVRNQFYDFDIIGVEEVIPAASNNSTYFVHIANDKKVETIKVYNGESEVVKEYKKG